MGGTVETCKRFSMTEYFTDLWNAGRQKWLALWDFNMGFDVTPMVIQTEQHSVPRYKGDTPYGPLVHEIHENMSCLDVLNYAHYVFYKRTQKVYFGGKEMNLEDVCQIFPTLAAR